ncbi:hypothetical protein [Psychroserpens sp.]
MEEEKKEESFKAETIENLTKVKANSIGGINFNFEGTEGKTEINIPFHESDFHDKTKIYHFNDSFSELIDTTTVQKYVNALQKSRIIIVHASSSNLLTAATSDLILAINSNKEYETSN